MSVSAALFRLRLSRHILIMKAEPRLLLHISIPIKIKLPGKTHYCGRADTGSFRQLIRCKKEQLIHIEQQIICHLFFAILSFG